MKLELDVIKRFDRKLKDRTGLRFLHDKEEQEFHMQMDRIKGTLGMRHISEEL